MAVVRIWDLPTRLFHWLFAAACTVAWLSGDEPRYTDLHFFAGSVALALVLFRLVWGVTGGRHARFSRFVKGPAAIMAHLHGLFDRTRPHEAGHNPLGALAVLAMLALVFFLGVTGLVVLGGEESAGPLNGLFSVAQAVQVHYWHEVLAWILLGLVGLHLGGVLLESLVQRVNLPRSMVTGMKSAHPDEAEPQNATTIAALILASLSAFSLYWFLPYQASDAEEALFLPFVAEGVRTNPVWEESCSECHLAYHPGLLPQRSWQRLLDGQADHFGEDLFLSPDTVAELSRYMADNSAERLDREVSWRTLQSLNDNESPVRITDTPYWQQVHRDIDKAVWKRPSVNGKFNCAACHLDAGQGGFMNGAMRLPD